MKKILITSILGLIFAAYTVEAQVSTRPRPFELGVYVGPSVNWLQSTTEGYNNKGIQFCGSYGLNLDINMFKTTSNYFFHTGINIRHVSGKMNFYDYDFNTADTLHSLFESRFNMAYLCVPTALKLQTNPLGNYIVYSIFGLDNSICVSANRKDRVNKAEYNPKNNKNYTAFFREALMISIGCEYIINDNTRITAGILYNNGFTNLFGKDFYSVNAFENKKVRERVRTFNRTLELQVGLVF